jgi:FlaA1/EpsC-like NDP-sugar epimerase
MMRGSSRTADVKGWIRIFRSRIAAFVHDLAMIPIAWLGAYWLRFNLEEVPPPYWREALLLVPIVVATQGAMFWYFGLYRGVWRFASVPDLMRILKAVVVGLLLSAAAVFLINRLVYVPRSVFLLEAILLLLLLGGPRFAYRWLKDRHLYRADGKRALIVGAGRAGEMLIRDMLRDASSQFRPVVLIDDDRRKEGKEIHGLPVAGGCAQVAEVAAEFDVDLIIIALPSATTRQIRRVVELCEKAGIPFRTIPRLQDIVSGKASIKDLRDVSIEDLLGREPVELDWAAIEQGSRGRPVLVTGGGGSIGSELCRQIARLSPARLIIFERNEYNLYTIEQELRENFPALDLVGILGDVCDATAVLNVFQTYAPHAVFHAAAYKHVPMLEAQLRSAVVNNALGTRVVASAADRHGCQSFVLISTDKAVNPASIMGVSKRVAEIVCQDLSRRSKTRFITVRFGNVLGSSGSVVPLFQQQIARGGPVTVTHPDVTRYFMTIPEASQLILQASVIGKGGEIFVLDMGEPIKISYLAEQLIRLSGKRPGEDIEITFTGLRAGEKLYEELFHQEEQLGKTAHPKILLANCRVAEHGLVNAYLENLDQACLGDDESTITRVLESLVPEKNRGVLDEPAAREYRRAGEKLRFN